MINIVYVDDKLDPDISMFLDMSYKNENFEKDYKEIDFTELNGYDDLLDHSYIKEANIIVIDSKLFENDRVSKSKFTGEEFKIILKKIFPFIEVIVITQNEFEEDYGTVRKYKNDRDKTANEYYSENLKKCLDKSVKNIEIYRNIAKKIKNNNGIDKLLVENILNSLSGMNEYDQLTKSDIDEIITTFKEIEKRLNGEGL